MPWEVLVLACSTPCTGLLPDEVLSTCMHPACGTTVKLQPEPSLFLVPSCTAVLSQHTRNEVVEVAAQSCIPCSSGDDSSRFKVGHQQGKGVTLLSPALSWFSRSPAHHQSCHTGLSEAEMSPSGKQGSCC